ncbi:MAG: porin [Candidatus Eisenbacteria bacterium]|uniref:Porin n=1 Tax=Eiseniibacteriota bacterium TaxID=2212470 RepID=A0A538TZS3_UNCEI|nr:MAG: porin [Candidatus Eisenbacteria bacterium]
MNTLRVFDFDDQSFKLDVFELVAQRPASKARESGFRADVVLGSSVPRVSAAAGLFRDDAGMAGDLDLQQAYASYVAPLGSGLRIDLGKFITPFGYEVIEGFDGWNDNATRSYLFGYAIPFTHTGARLAYAFSSRIGLTAVLANGWDDARDDNRAKTVGAQLALTPLDPLVLVVGAMTGPERADNDSDPRSLLDVTLMWKSGGTLALGANGDWGAERNALGPDADAHWSGIAGYARWEMTAGLAWSLRAETFDDVDGTRTGVHQRLSELTLTPEAKVSANLRVRGDLRFDHSDQAVFEKRGGTSDRQTTVLVGALYSF